MKHGKHICNTLKAIRLDIARANGIKYAPRECHHEGDCAGTCPACESEMRYLEREIARKRSLGKAALIAGVSLGLMSVTATSCDFISESVQRIVHIGSDEPLAGAVAYRYDEDSIMAELYTMNSDKSILVGEFFDNGPKAVFPGGPGALLKFIKQNFVCPEGVSDETFTVVEVDISSEGRVEGEPYVMQVSENCDSAFVAEAVRVSKILPQFEPAKMEDGTAGKSMYFLLFDAKRLKSE